MKVKNPINLNSGIVVLTTRSGEVHASFFDEDNDYQSLFSALNHLATKYIEGISVNHIKNDDCISLYDAIKDHLRKRDCGSVCIVENEE